MNSRKRNVMSRGLDSTLGSFCPFHEERVEPGLLKDIQGDKTLAQAARDAQSHLFPRNISGTEHFQTAFSKVHYKNGRSH